MEQIPTLLMADISRHSADHDDLRHPAAVLLKNESDDTAEWVLTDRTEPRSTETSSNAISRVDAVVTPAAVSVLITR